MKQFSKRIVLVGTMVMMLLLSTIVVNADVANCGVKYTVARGDTLSSIARKFSTTTTILQQMNRLPNINIIYVGQQLCVTGVSNQPQPIPNQPGQATGKVVKAYWLNVRSGPGVQFTILRTVRRNDVLLLNGRSSDSRWIMLGNTTHTMEWVSAAYIETANVNSLPIVQNTTQSPISAPVIANSAIYFGPGTDWAQTGGAIYANQNITILGKNINTTWYKIQTAQGTGWVPTSAFPDSIKLYLFPVVS